MWLALLLACAPIPSADSSRCTEPRRPHPTSCAIFYSCANLPDGGYAWVPSRCTDGLVFQPYLRMCVVPGDVWTCDVLSTDATETAGEAPEPADPTGHLGYTQDPSEFSEAIDSSYAMDDTSDETTVEAVTARPPIEFAVPDGAAGSGEGSARNASRHRKKENYSYGCANNRWHAPLPPLMPEHKERVANDRYKLLNQLMSRLHVYEELSAALSDTLSIGDHRPLGDTTAANPTRSVATLASHDRKRNVSLSYLVRSYVEGSASRGKHQADETRTESATASSVLPIDGLDADNSIVMIRDGLGGTRYLTVDGYRAAAWRLTSRQSVSVVTCTRNVRLPNATDCGRYYTCDPRTASVTEYTCPLHTAFNAHARICDTESARACGGKREPAPSGTLVDEDDGDASPGEPCREVGKTKDPASDFHYYICYSVPGSDGITSIRMTCPNALIFCPSTRVCTVGRLCDV